MPPMRSFIFLLAALLLAAPRVDAARPPNVIVILVDDMGFTDLSCYGSALNETPHIDRLAKQGTRLTNAYSACTVCSPTRAALLTGQYPARLHVTDWIAGHERPKAKLKVPDWTKQLPAETVTIAEALKPAGYVSASIGKWHLGGADSRPEAHGFDLNVGGYEKGQPPSYVAPYNIPTLKPEGPEGEFLTDRESAEAVKFIEANRDRPFFLYLPHYAVHTPLAGKPDVVAKYKAKAAALPAGHKQRNAVYAALVESVDDSVGRIMKKLDELKLADDTLVIFTSDNGGLLPVTDNTPARAGKGSAYEGGVRVPLIIRWPKHATAGEFFHDPVFTCDLYPTILAAAGVKPADGQPVDGMDLTGMLKTGTPPKRDAIFWHYPHYHPGGATPYGAVRAGDWRLIEFYETGRVELYNLNESPEEAEDVAADNPEKVKELQERLQVWRESVGAQMPTPNPDYDPAQSEEKRPAK
jgi:arylsulfatase A-like enzyme